jgi:hypothetical protein
LEEGKLIINEVLGLFDKAKIAPLLLAEDITGLHEVPEYSPPSSHGCPYTQKYPGIIPQIPGLYALSCSDQTPDLDVLFKKRSKPHHSFNSSHLPFSSIQGTKRHLLHLSQHNNESRSVLDAPQSYAFARLSSLRPRPLIQIFSLVHLRGSQTQN